MKDGTDIMIFVADPGPANYIATLPAALAKKGRETTVFAAGLAREHLRKRGIRFEPVSPFMTADDVLSKICPRLLLTGTSENPDSLGLSLILAARRERITSVGLIDAGVNAIYRFRGRHQDSRAYAPDWILVPDEWTRQDFITLGFPEEKTIVCGHPNYDHVMDQKKFLSDEGRLAVRHRLLPGVPDDKKILIFVSEGSENVQLLSPKTPLQEYSMTGRGCRTGRTEIIMEEFLIALKSIPQKPYLLLRLHPKDDPDDFLAYVGDFDWIDWEAPVHELVFCADLVVGMTSMLIMEAALLGRPTLPILPRDIEKDWLHSIRAGMTTYVTKRSELIKVLADHLKTDFDPLAGNNRPFIPYGSLQRTVGFIDDLLRS